MQSIKCVVVGDRVVGKTCLLISYTMKSFPGKYVPTIFDNYSATVWMMETPIHLNLWDTVGQEDYDRLRPLTYEKSNVFIVCFSLVNWASYRHVLTKWYPEISQCRPNAPFILVGTKLDLAEDEIFVERMMNKGENPVSFIQGMNLARQIGAHTYIECSALTQKGVKQVFHEAVCAALTPGMKKKQAKCHIL